MWPRTQGCFVHACQGEAGLQGSGEGTCLPGVSESCISLVFVQSNTNQRIEVLLVSPNLVFYKARVARARHIQEYRRPGVLDSSLDFNPDSPNDLEDKSLGCAELISLPRNERVGLL